MFVWVTDQISSRRGISSATKKATFSFLSLVALLTITGVVTSAFSYLSDSANATWSVINILFQPRDLLAGFASIAAGTMLLRKNRYVWALVSLVITLVVIPNGLLFVRSIDPVAAILGGIIGYIVLRRTTWNRKDAILWLFVVFLVWSAVIAATWPKTIAFASIEPTGKSWNFDPVASLKMYYLMKSGTGYYDAYLTAIALNAGVSPAQILAARAVPGFHAGGIMDFRGPFVFYLWMMLPNGSYIYGTYLLLASTAIACGYWAFSRMSRRTGLIAATLLMPYLTVGVGGALWLEWEFWGSLFSIFAFTLYLRGYRKFAVVPALFAGACKETLAGALLAGLVGSAIRRDKKEILAWAGGLVAYGAYETWHFLNLVSYYHVTFDFSRVTNGGFGFVQATFHFGTPWLRVGLSGALLGLSILGVLGIRPFHLSAYAFVNTLLPMAAFMFIGYKWDDYWGVVYVPFVLVMAAYLAGTLRGDIRAESDTFRQSDLVKSAEP